MKNENGIKRIVGNYKIDKDTKHLENTDIYTGVWE
jgi:hypothetical protein